MTGYNDLSDQVEALRANIDYIHENIQECQDNIMSMEESKVSVYVCVRMYLPSCGLREGSNLMVSRLCVCVYVCVCVVMCT